MPVRPFHVVALAALGAVVALNIVVAPSTVGVAPPAAKDADLQKCMNDHLDPGLGGCSAVIARNAESRTILAYAYGQRGYYEHLKGDYEQAIADYTKSGELDPTAGETFYDLGLAYVEIHNDAKAVESFSRDLALRPKDIHAYFERGNLYGLMGDYGNAIVDLTRVIALNPTNADAYFRRGYAYHKQHRYDLAVADYSQTLTYDPNLTNIYLDRAMAYSALGQYERAIPDYTRVIAANPNHPYAFSMRSAAYKALGDRERAREDSDRHLRIIVADTLTNYGCPDESEVAHHNGDLARQIEALPFTVSERFCFTIGEVPSEKTASLGSPNKNVPGLIIIVRGDDTVPAADRKQVTEELARGIDAGVVGIETSREITINGDPGYEVIANGKTKRGTDTKVVLWMRFLPAGDISMVITTRADIFQTLLPRFTAIRDSIRPK